MNLQSIAPFDNLIRFRKAERVAVDLDGFRTCGDRRGQVPEID